jgi:hypothetical protein
VKVLASPRDVLARVVRIGDALDDGEHELARTLLRDLEHDLSGRPPRELRCPYCPRATFYFAGELASHLRNTHGEDVA